MGDLLHALEDYLRVLLGLVKDGKYVLFPYSSCNVMVLLLIGSSYILKGVLCNIKCCLVGSIKKMKQRSNKMSLSSI